MCVLCKAQALAVCRVFRLSGNRQVQNVNAARFNVLKVEFIKGSSLLVQSAVSVWKHLAIIFVNLIRLCVQMFCFQE